MTTKYIIDKSAVEAGLPFVRKLGDGNEVLESKASLREQLRRLRAQIAAERAQAAETREDEVQG